MNPPGRSITVGFAMAVTFASMGMAAEKPSSEKITVVASFSILADMVRTIGGEHVRLHTLVGPNGDAHEYQPSAEAVKILSTADVFVINGLGFEGWFERLVASTGYRGRIIVASGGVEKELMPDGHPDPHAWQDIRRSVSYVQTITEGLCTAASEACPVFRQNARDYIQRLDSLDEAVRVRMSKIAPEKRVIITTHDAFGYFGHAYGIKFLAVQGANGESEASAATLARLIEQARSDKAHALFIENISDPRALEQIGRETGLVTGGTLYSDSLSPPDGPAATYEAMMRTNAETIARALEK